MTVHFLQYDNTKDFVCKFDKKKNPTIYPLKIFDVIDNHQKDTSLGIVRYCGTKVADESQLQSTALLFTAQGLLPQVLH